MTSTFPRRLARKIRQTRRLSRKSIAFLFLLAGSALVALTALFFAHLADFALELNAKLVQQYPWFAWIALPPGLPVIVWLTRKFAPFTAGSGIPQVIASLSLPYGAQKTRLIRLGQTLLKIPLTFLGMLFGASIGREGPSVQVGAAVMGAWGAWCKKHGLAFKGMQENDLMAAGLVCGAAGGIFARMLYRGAAAFAPRKIRGFIRNRPLLLAALMGLLLALLGTFYQGKTYGTGYHEAAQALHGIYEAPVGLAAAKWLATVFSYWAGIPGGIFTPSLTIGAVLGEHIAAIADISQGANIIVLICMAAFLAGATQSPITSAVVVMEMTGGQSLLFWMLIACIFASQVSRQFSPRPFYHASGMRFRRRVLQETAAQTGNAPARPQAANSKTGMPSEN
ncbi:TPA: chloride channel protein [Neisseria gonorrhoeae]